MRTLLFSAILAGACGPRDIQVLGDGRHDLTAPLRADRIEVMPEAVVYLGPGATLEATEDLRLAGTIEGLPAAGPITLTAGRDVWVLGKVAAGAGIGDQPGQDLRLVAGRNLVVRGVARGGDGADGADVEAQLPPAGAGGAGGSIHAEAGRDLIVSGVLTGGKGGAGGDATWFSDAEEVTALSGNGGRGGDVRLHPTRRLAVAGAATGGAGGPAGTARSRGLTAASAVGLAGDGGDVVLERTPTTVAVPGTIRGGDSGMLGTAITFADGQTGASVIRSPSSAAGKRVDIPGEDGRNAGAEAAWARIPDMPRDTLEAVERTSQTIPMATASAAPIVVMPVGADPKAVTITRAALDAVLGEAPEIQYARARPVRRQGQVVGFRLSGLRRHEPLHRLGLRNGDVITAVNSQPITSMSEAMKAYQANRDASDFAVALERSGERIVQRIKVR